MRRARCRRKLRLPRLQAQHEKEKEELHAEIGRLTMQVNWLQKNIAAGTAPDYLPGSGRAKRSRTACAGSLVYLFEKDERKGRTEGL